MELKIVLLFVIEIAKVLFTETLDDFFTCKSRDSRGFTRAKGDLKLTFRSIGETLPSLVAANFSVRDVQMILSRLAKLAKNDDPNMYFGECICLTPAGVIRTIADSVSRNARMDGRSTSSVLQELLAMEDWNLLREIWATVEWDNAHRIDQLHRAMDEVETVKAACIAREEAAAAAEAYLESIENWADHKWFGAKLRG